MNDSQEKPSTYELEQTDDTVRVTLAPEFMVDDWKALEAQYRGLIDRDHLLWVLDLRRMQFLNSMMLGLIVGFHAVLKTRGGRLGLVVEAGSPVSKLITLSKLHSILQVEEA